MISPSVPEVVGGEGEEVESEVVVDVVGGGNAVAFQVAVADESSF